MVRYMILDNKDVTPEARKVILSDLMSYVIADGKTILARYGTNKTTLRKILKKAIS